MSPTLSEAALLLVDVTGSTRLYEEVGDSAAFDQIGQFLARLKAIASAEGGSVVLSKGDDLLCAFRSPSAGLRAVRQMLAIASGPLAIHAGLHYGAVVHAEGDVFGDAVNLTARLSAIAKPGEALVSRMLLDRLPPEEAALLSRLGNVAFKGKSAQIEVFSLVEEDPAARTEVMAVPGLARRSFPDATLILHFSGRSQPCREAEVLAIGRATECDLLLGFSWVSRRHALVSVRRGKVQLQDVSSLGTYVTLEGGYELFLRRETVLLTGSGLISPALKPSDARAQTIRYEVLRGPASGA
ncbi:MAG TPA: adenylate/guanylate cyclase domain-containing protein [Paracoccaceae bacterium]|nr:adenylate/guanylate cyclase domain-containing protein [Paracoccaceae bacterium]